MNEVTTSFSPLEPDNPPDESPLAKPDRPEGWTFTRWFMVIALVFATQVALIFLLGDKKELVPRAVLNVPMLKLADDTGEYLALTDPTLFVLPNPRDFASADWLKISEPELPSFRWTEPPRWLPFSTDGLSAAFAQFMQTNSPASPTFNFRPILTLSAPTLPAELMPVQHSTMQVEDALTQRLLPSKTTLTNWPYADVLAPCVVQVLVNPVGNVVSTVLLKSCDYKPADDQALELARALRFTPAANLTFGRIIFNWQTVPPNASP